MYTNRYPQMVHEFYVQRVRKIMAERHTRIMALKNRKDAEAYVRNVRKVIDKAFKPYFPEKKCDLAARVTGTKEYQDFVLEKIVYQSHPGLYVTGKDRKSVV